MHLRPRTYASHWVIAEQVFSSLGLASIILDLEKGSLTILLRGALSLSLEKYKAAKADLRINPRPFANR